MESQSPIEPLNEPALRTPLQDELDGLEDVGMFDYLRWWHWLILAALFVFGLLYYPMWRFDRQWRRIQVGDSFDRVKDVLGDPGPPSYTVAGAQGDCDAYVYSVYWRTFELLVSPESSQVISKFEFAVPSPGTQPFPTGPTTKP
jgi:hypothetical protein